MVRVRVQALALGWVRALAPVQGLVQARALVLVRAQGPALKLVLTSTLTLMLMPFWCQLQQIRWHRRMTPKAWIKAPHKPQRRERWGPCCF